MAQSHSGLVLCVTALAASSLLPAQVREKRVVPVDPDQSSHIVDRRGAGVAILVGLGKYPRFSGLSALRYPASDVDHVRTELEAQHYLVLTLKDEEATRAAILSAIRQGGQALDPKTGVMIFFFSGHGFAVNGANYLAAYDSANDSLAESGLPLSRVEEALTKAGATRRTLWIDACRNDPSAKGASGDRSFTGFAGAEGTRILFSTKAGSVSWEDDELKQGIFSYFLQKGLAGAAAREDGFVSFRDLADYVTSEVQKQSAHEGRIQTPYESGESSHDFLIAVARPPEPAVTLDNGAFASSLRSVMHAAEDDFRSVKGEPSLRSAGRQWSAGLRLPGASACQVRERGGVLEYDCVAPLAATRDAALDRYEAVVRETAKTLGAGWQFDVQDAPPGAGVFTRAVEFHKVATAAASPPTGAPPSNAPVDTLHVAHPFGLGFEMLETKLVIAAVDPHGFGASIGMMKGDTIVEVNGQKVNTFVELERLEHNLPANSRVAFKVIKKTGGPRYLAGKKPELAGAALPHQPAGDANMDDFFKRFFGDTPTAASSITVLIRVFERESGSASSPPCWLAAAVVKTMPAADSNPKRGDHPGAIGVTYEAVQKDPTVYTMMGADHGALVIDARDNGPAAKAGVRKGDVIVAMDHSPIWDGSELQTRALNIKAGDRVILTCLRNKTELDLTLTAAEFDEIYPPDPAKPATPK